MNLLIVLQKRMIISTFKSTLSDIISNTLKKIHTNTKSTSNELFLRVTLKIKVINVKKKSNSWLKASQNRKFSSKFKPVNHIIFDVDGLLLDTEIVHYQVFKEIAAKYGKTEYPWEIREKVLGRKEADSAAIFIKEMELPISVEEFIKMQHEKQREGLINSALMPGAERLIHHLKEHNIPMAVASSSSYESILEKFSKRKELFKCFHHVVSGTTDPEVKQGKPAPDIFLVCATRFSAKPKPEKCLVFEDAPSGVNAAVSAEMQVVMVPDHNLSPQFTKDATLVLKSLNDFKPAHFGLPPFPS